MKKIFRFCRYFFYRIPTEYPVTADDYLGTITLSFVLGASICIAIVAFAYFSGFFLEIDWLFFRLDWWFVALCFVIALLSLCWDRIRRAWSYSGFADLNL